MQAFIARYYRVLFASLLAIVLGLTFYVGFLEGKNTEEQKVTLSCNNNIMSTLSIPLQTLAAGNTPSTKATTGAFVGSVNGTKYYAPSCSAAQRIKPANDIWFDSAEDAQIQGYSAGKC